MKFEELFETALFEFGSTHAAPGRGAGVFSQGAYQQLATWLSEIDDSEIRLAMAEVFADVFDADSYNFKRDLFMKAVQAGKTFGANFRWQQRHYWAMATAIKALPSQHQRDFMGTWLGDKLENQRYRSGGQYDRAFRRELWDSACGIEGSDPRYAQNPYSKKSRDGDFD